MTRTALRELDDAIRHLREWQTLPSARDGDDLKWHFRRPRLREALQAFRRFACRLGLGGALSSAIGSRCCIIVEAQAPKSSSHWIAIPTT